MGVRHTYDGERKCVMFNVNPTSALLVIAIAAIWTIAYKICKEVDVWEAVAVICIGRYASRAMIWEVLIVLAMLLGPVQAIVEFVFWFSIGMAIVAVVAAIFRALKRRSK